MKSSKSKSLGRGLSGNRQAEYWRPVRVMLIAFCLSLLAIWLLPILNRWVRSELIHQLASRVAQAPDDQVEVPIRQVASFGLQAIDTLMAIATSPRTAPAAIARKMVDRQVATWVIQDQELRAQDEDDHPSTSMSRRLSRLAEALVRHVDSLDTAGRRWAQRLTMQIVLHADRITPAQSVQVLADCQRVLAIVLPGKQMLRGSQASGSRQPGSFEQGHNMDGNQPTSSSLQSLRVKRGKIPKPRTQAPVAQKDPIEQLIPPLDRPAIPWNLLAVAPRKDPAPAEQLNPYHHFLQAGRDLNHDYTGSRLQKIPDTSNRSPLFSPLARIDSSGHIPSPRIRKPVELLPADHAERDLAKPPRLADNPLREYVEPRFSTELAVPESTRATALPQVTNRSAALTNQVLDVPTPREMAARRKQLQTMPLRDLIVRLGHAQDYEAALIRSIALAQGLTETELALASDLASPRVKDRLALLSKLSLLPASHARRWLRWLLEDADGEVRLQSLVRMATTSDSQLAALARRLVLEDTDPRVVELATRIVEER